MITIWNKLLQELLFSEDSGSIRLGIMLVSDSRTVYWWSHLKNWEAKKLGLPWIPDDEWGRIYANLGKARKSPHESFYNTLKKYKNGYTVE